MITKFIVPTSLQDLERSPYNLLPYPTDFADEDEVARADSFDKLVKLVEDGNKNLSNCGMALFERVEGVKDAEEWNNGERIQAMYTLVRKSSSLAKGTKKKFVKALCSSVSILSSILSAFGSTASPEEEELQAGQTSTEESQTQASLSSNQVVSQAFRNSLAFHIYMLFSIMFTNESEAKIEKSVNAGALSRGKSQRKKNNSQTKKEKERKADAAEVAAIREACASSMLLVAQSMGTHKSKLWKRGVPDEDIIALPCRIAYQMLEVSTGVIGRKAASGDAALGIIVATVQSADSILSTVVAALLDLLHSYDHMAVLVADLCCMLPEKPINKLAVELIREIGHLDTSHALSSETGGKASGVKNVAPFINELAARNPKLVMAHINMLLPHLDSEPYYFRSAIVSAIGQIVAKTGIQKQNDCVESEDDSDESKENIEESDLQTEGQEIKNKQIKSKTKDNLLDILLERAHDTSSFTRTAVLKTWASLVEDGLLPINRLMPVTDLAIDRLKDKAVLVRKNSMQLLTLLLENNPFMGSLDPNPYLEKVKELEHFFLQNMPKDIKDAEEAAQKEVSEDDDTLNERDKIKYAALEAALDEYENQGDPENMTDRQRELFTKAKTLKFSRSALVFISKFEGATTTFQSMMLSANTSDVTETLRFFVRARHFQLPCAVSGMRSALALMWSTEKSIQDEVISAFIEVFLCVPGNGGKKMLSHKEIAQNLLLLTSQATVSELASIEEAIRRLVKDDKIPTEVFLYLWTLTSKTSAHARASALHVLSMAASADPSIVDNASTLRMLLDTGLGDITEDTRDWSTARAAACLVQNMTPVKPDQNSAKYLVIEMIIERLCIVAHGSWCNDSDTKDTQAWFSAAEQAINAIFVISHEPDAICKVIIRVLEATTFGFGTDTPIRSCHSLSLSRFLFVISHIALKLLVYTETLTASVRRANAARTLSKQEKADKAKAEKKANQSTDESDSDDDIEAELGMAQAAEAETEFRAAEISEKEIIGRGLIGLFSPLLIRIVANEDGTFSSEILKQTATLALCKFMCISRSFCEKHLPLLFTTLSKAPTNDITLRANTVIALGDLAFRFPNEVEPYTPHLYACLKDKSTRVRRHTLMVLTHLILNDMVKVKGQVCEIALCLEDEEIRIRDMARLVFHELSKRSNNPIYNLLPDIVSRLSEMNIPKDSFRSILSFLLGFIKKDRQIEMLIEKLCQRFPKCSSISQKADIAFCLAQLKANEKCIKIMMDNLKFYKDALFDEDVHKNFVSIILKVKKSSPKPELKMLLSEWEDTLSKCSAAGMENQLADQKALSAKQKSRRRAQKKGKRGGKKPSRKEYEGETDEEENVSDSYEGETDLGKENVALPEEIKTKSQRETRARRSRRKIVV